MNALQLPLPSYRTDEEFTIFVDSVGKFLDQNAPPERVEKWRKEKCEPLEFWKLARSAGLLGLSIPEEYGGHGGNYRHGAILQEEIGRRGIEGWDVALHNAIVAPYITD